MRTCRRLILTTALIILGVGLEVNAGGTVKDYTFFSESLNREMTCRVYLPEAYDYSDSNKRFPVIYFLHGASLGYENYDALYLILDNFISLGLLKPVITIMPDGLAPPYNGSFYTNSALYGNFEDYISHDLVQFVDGTFNTLAVRDKRAIMGASMGAYGALKAAFRHPQTFIGVVGHSGPVNTAMLDIFIPDLIKEDGGSAPYHWSPGPGKSLTNLTFTMAGAFSPNLTNEFFVDFPLDSLANTIPEVMKRWNQENICEIAKIMDPHPTLGIRFDCGNADEFYLHYQNRALSDTLSKYGIPHVYEEYSGTHTNGLPVRVGLSLLYLDLLFKTGFTGTEQIPIQMDWVVSPNPATSELFVVSNLAFPANDAFLKLLDMNGRTVYQSVLPGSSNKLNIKGLSDGLYLYEITHGSKIVQGKLIITGH